MGALRRAGGRARAVVGPPRRWPGGGSGEERVPLRPGGLRPGCVSRSSFGRADSLCVSAPVSHSPLKSARGRELHTEEPWRCCCGRKWKGHVVHCGCREQGSTGQAGEHRTGRCLMGPPWKLGARPKGSRGGCCWTVRGALQTSALGVSGELRRATFLCTWAVTAILAPAAGVLGAAGPGRARCGCGAWAPDSGLAGHALGEY